MVNNGIFDTHCHLMSKHYQNEDLNNLLNNAFVAGVGNILSVGYNLETSNQAVSQAYQYANDSNTPKVFAAVGVHPTEVHNINDKVMTQLIKFIQTGKVIAIGEIGLDYFHKDTAPELQKKWFIEQLKLAKKYNLPVLLHIRNAFEDAYKIVKEQGITKGVLHCFTGTSDIAKKFLKLGFYVSFAGNLTYKNARDLQAVVKDVPNNRILVETDAPYLTPEPLRGKKPNKYGLTINFPVNIIFTVRKIAELKMLPEQNVRKMVNENAITLFNLK
ncbi:MAG: TatD family hydrolase [Spiroplasma sp.]|nr:TatD family hydrolase [Spiroplasma sp.]